MRFFLKSIVAILLAAVVAGALTYPAWLLVSVFADVRPDRVLRRVAMITLAVALYFLLRREGLASKETLGYGIPRAKFIRHMIWGYVGGILLMLPLTWALFGLDLRTSASAESHLIQLFLYGTAQGLVIAFVEETFMRGAMYRVIERESGLRLAILLPAILYAAVHFMDGKLRIPASEMTFVGGLDIAAHTFERYAAPLEIVDSFFALLALGVLLAFVRRKTGAIAGGIGLHAGGVCVISILHEMSVVNPNASMPWLVGSYDGVIGWLAFVWIGLIAALYGWRTSKSRPH